MRRTDFVRLAKGSVSRCVSRHIRSLVHGGSSLGSVRRALVADMVRIMWWTHSNGGGARRR